MSETCKECQRAGEAFVFANPDALARHKEKRHAPAVNELREVLTARQARENFILVCRVGGRGFRKGSVELVPEASLAEGGTDCWTHAWRDGRTYVEGVCLVNGVVKAHAWVLDDQERVVELTPGYESARAYMGFVLDRERAEEATQTWGDEPRSSLLEVCLSVGANPRYFIKEV